MAGKKRAGRFGYIERRQRAGQTMYRARWACPPCQAELDAQWREEVARAAAQGPAAVPARPRAQHHTRWDASQAAAVAVLEEVRRDRAQVELAGLPLICWLRDQEDETKGDEQWFGPPLRLYAERVLADHSRAEGTLIGYKKHYEDTATDTSGKPLGIEARWGYRPIKAITRAEVRAWVAELVARPGKRPGTTLSPSQVRQRFYLLRRIMREAMDDDAITTDPTIGVRVPALPQGRAVTGLLRAEEDGRWLPDTPTMEKIVATCDERSRLAVGMLYGLGLRAGEATALLRNDLRKDAEKNWSVVISKSESQSSGRPKSDTKNHQRHVRHVPGWLVPYVEAHLTKHPGMKPEDRLFPAVRGAAVSLSHTAMRRDLRASLAGLELGSLSLQDLRAAGEANVAARLGRPAAAQWARHGLQVQMGHYVGADQERVSKEAAGL